MKKCFAMLIRTDNEFLLIHLLYGQNTYDIQLSLDDLEKAAAHILSWVRQQKESK